MKSKLFFLLVTLLLTSGHLMASVDESVTNAEKMGNLAVQVQVYYRQAPLRDWVYMQPVVSNTLAMYASCLSPNHSCELPQNECSDDLDTIFSLSEKQSELIYHYGEQKITATQFKQEYSEVSNELHDKVGDWIICEAVRLLK